MIDRLRGQKQGTQGTAPPGLRTCALQPARNALLPTPYSLLPTPYSLLPTPYSLLPTPYSLLPTPYSLLHSTPGTTLCAPMQTSATVTRAKPLARHASCP